ncbi:hypothetical protein MAPG_01941, partial [Magnaporthiopsis poae ATCC 64411]
GARKRQQVASTGEKKRQLKGEAALRARMARQRKEALRYAVDRLETEVAQKERELRTRLGDVPCTWAGITAIPARKVAPSVRQGVGISWSGLIQMSSLRAVVRCINSFSTTLTHESSPGDRRSYARRRFNARVLFWETSLAMAAQWCGPGKARGTMQARVVLGCRSRRHRSTVMMASARAPGKVPAANGQDARQALLPFLVVDAMAMAVLNPATDSLEVADSAANVNTLEARASLPGRLPRVTLPKPRERPAPENKPNHTHRERRIGRI